MSPLAKQEMRADESPWYPANVGDLVVAIVVIASYAGFGGYKYAQHVQAQEAARLAAIPKVTYPAPAARLQLGCTKQDFREHLYACTQRKRSDITGHIEPITKGKL